MHSLLELFNKIKDPKHPKELQRWIEKHGFTASDFLTLNQKRITELYKRKIIAGRGKIADSVFDLQMGSFSMQWNLGDLPEIAVELIMQNSLSSFMQFERGVFELKKSDISIYQSCEEVGKKRQVYEFNSLLDQIERALKSFPGADKIELWHTHPFVEGIAISKQKIAVKIHPLSPTDIRTCIEVNRRFAIDCTVHAVTKTCSHYSFKSSSWSDS